MDNLRFILLSSLGLVLLMLWQAWQKDYGDHGQLPFDQQSSPPIIVDVPGLPKSVPISTVKPKVTGLAVPEATTLLQSQEVISVTTDLYQIDISKKGGGINQVKLLDYSVSLQDEQPVLLLTDQPSKFHIVQGGLLSESESPTHEAIYNSEHQSYTLADKEQYLVVPLIWRSDSGLMVEKSYRFSRDSYLIEIQYQIENYTGKDWLGRAYSQLQRSDPGRTSNILYTYTGAVISSPEQRYQKISFGDMEDQSLDVDIINGWAAMLQHYFVSALIPLAIDQPHHYYTLTPQDNRYVIGQITPPVVVASETTAELQQRLYIGPKIQARLKLVAEGLELTVDYGVLWLLARPLFWCLEKFHSITGNWGWAIVLITLMLKLIFFQFSAISYRSMANMRRVQPRLIALRDRHKGDRMKLNQAMMDLYKKEKINPLGGCLPIVIQIPVFIALYWVLLESVELRQSTFIFWLTDLSAPDQFYVLPLLMGATMLIQQRLNPMPIDPIQQKVMSILPVVFTVFFAFFPSGLVLYWVVNNILSIAQQWIITRNIESTTVISNQK